MTPLALIEYKDASPEVRAVYDDMFFCVERAGDR